MHCVCCESDYNLKIHIRTFYLARRRNPSNFFSILKEASHNIRSLLFWLVAMVIFARTIILHCLNKVHIQHSSRRVTSHPPLTKESRCKEQSAAT